MTFLKKLGSILLQVGKIVLPISPDLTALVMPGAAGNELSGILTTIVQVEAIGQAAGLTGAQKLAAAAPLVGNAFAQTSLLAKRPIKDPAAAQAAIAGITSNIANLLNAYDGGSLISTPVPQAPALVAAPAAPAAEATAETAAPAAVAHTGGAIG